MKKSKILLVDDNPENLMSLEALLEADDREIFKANSGNEGLKLVRIHEFALILTDVQMPEMDGFEMVEIIRRNKKTKNVPVIFVTASNKEEECVHRGYNEGAMDYIFKPLDPKIVAAKVDNFVTIWRQKAELEELNEQKNKFLGMAAHDIRNPLEVIDFYAQDLLEEIEDKKSDAYKKLEYIKMSVKFIKSLVDELLDVAKIESGNIELNKSMVNLSFFLSEIAEFNRLFSVKKNIRLVEKFDVESYSCFFDKQKITQVLNNLLTNAIKFSNSETSIEFGASFKNNLLTFWVKDEGQGIPKNEIDKLFIPFTKTSVCSTAGETSTGLGLTIVKKVIEAHRGEVSVTSQVGVGSTFKIEIPIQNLEEQINNTDSSDKSMNLYIGKGLSVLLIDDDIIVHLIMKQVFEKLGFSVTTASEGKTAIEKANAEKFDIIFCDINFPGMSGVEIVQHIRVFDKSTPIIGLTAGVSDKKIQECLDVGMNEVYVKNLGELQLFARNILSFLPPTK